MLSKETLTRILSGNDVAAQKILAAVETDAKTQKILAAMQRLREAYAAEQKKLDDQLQEIQTKCDHVKEETTCILCGRNK